MKIWVKGTRPLGSQGQSDLNKTAEQPYFRKWHQQQHNRLFNCAELGLISLRHSLSARVSRSLSLSAILKRHSPSTEADGRSPPFMRPKTQNLADFYPQPEGIFIMSSHLRLRDSP
ncbi:hypothetical protein L798_02993 [Zootermopsis nevadensis]|uniref:Uncharacterized protein n=1 Tax=Zootermopsis nevadensis TaxID=136037 RepID=A0A067QQG2_ZOONE|nr:hypothetical protein L798_02993 [Zootermopsis nevadensis]